MAKYQLINKAVEDLSFIWNYTLNKWSEKQADKYCHALLSTCKDIASNPKLGKSYKLIADELFGLKTGSEINNKEELLNNFKGNIGEQLGLFKIFGKSDTEIIIGEDDKHLNFRISLLLDHTKTETNNLTISTTVKFNNWFGKLYFLPVKPFHKVIVPIMLKGIIREVERQSTTYIERKLII